MRCFSVLRPAARTVQRQLVRRHSTHSTYVATPARWVAAQQYPDGATFETDSELLERVGQYASKKQTSVSLETLMNTGKGELLHVSKFADRNTHMENFSTHEKTQMQIASFLQYELPIRLAHRANELRYLPHGLSDVPSIQFVRSWYEQSFQEIMQVPEVVDMVTTNQLASVLEGVYQRHSDTLVTVASGLFEFRRSKDGAMAGGSSLHKFNEIHSFLDKFFLHRIGIRMLIGQFLEVRQQQQSPQNNFVGLVCTNTSPHDTIKEASAHARFMCERHFGDAPYVQIQGSTDLDFAYVPSHLYYMLFELLKNSMRAVVEHATTEEDPYPDLPDVRVVIADGLQNEDVVIKISDEGGSFPRSHLERIFSYLYTTARGNELTSSSDIRDHSTEGPLAGLGYGLPISRAYARYFGGDLTLLPMVSRFGLPCLPCTTPLPPCLFLSSLFYFRSTLQ